MHRLTATHPSQDRNGWLVLPLGPHPYGRSVRPLPTRPMVPRPRSVKPGPSPLFANDIGEISEAILLARLGGRCAVGRRSEPSGHDPCLYHSAVWRQTCHVDDFAGSLGDWIQCLSESQKSNGRNNARGSEFQSRLKSNHSRRAVAAQANS